MIKVKCILEDYSENSPMSKEEVTVENHWCYTERIRLTVNGHTVTLLAKDLQAAIANCTNTARF